MFISEKIYWLEKKIKELEQRLSEVRKRILVLEEKEPVKADSSNDNSPDTDPEAVYYERVMQEIRDRKNRFNEENRKRNRKNREHRNVSRG